MAKLSTPKRVLTSGDVAGYCGVHFRTVIRWIEKGSLKAYKLPGRGNNRIDEQDFVDFLQDNGMPVPEELQNHNKRILIVDDEKPMAAAIARVLKRAGFETATATDGFSAGLQLASFKPVLMTLDLSMPNMNGFEVLDIMANNTDYKNVKVLVVSALDDQKLQQAKEAGADDVLAKPFENKTLLASINKLLNTN